MRVEHPGLRRNLTINFILTLFLMKCRTVSKNLLHFNNVLFTNKAQFDIGFSEILKLKDDSVPSLAILELILHHTIE